MSKSTISTFQLAEMFPDEAAARQYFEAYRWPTGPVCPGCKEEKRIAARKNRDGFYHCNACKLDFTVRTHTIFDRSHIPLHKWLHAMYQLMTARKGVSSLQLGKEIGVTQKSAWFMLHRIRQACKGDLTKLRGIVEMDECYIGGKESNKHMKDRMYGDKGIPSKTAIVAMRERGGRTKAVLPETVSAITLEQAVRDPSVPTSLRPF